MVKHHLLYNFVLSEDTSVVELLRKGGRAMQDGPGQYQFGIDNGARASRHLPHETLSLQVLSLINKGNPRTNGVSYLTSHHPVALNMTIGSLTDPLLRSRFGHPTLCVENSADGPQLIVRAGEITFHFSAPFLTLHLLPLVIRRSDVRFSMTEEYAWPRTHTCLSTRYTQLIDEATEGDFPADDDDSEAQTSGGEAESASEEEDENMPEAPLLSTSVPAPGRHVSLGAAILCS